MTRSRCYSAARCTIQTPAQQARRRMPYRLEHSRLFCHASEEFPAVVPASCSRWGAAPSDGRPRRVQCQCVRTDKFPNRRESEQTGKDHASEAGASKAYCTCRNSNCTQATGRHVDG